jgi:cell division septation protein DedD
MKVNSRMAASQDTEITLGTGRMLAVFFTLVAICAGCFGVGYSVGRSSGESPTVADRPAAGVTKNVAKVASSASPTKAGSSDELTFFHTVKQRDANPQLTSAEAETDGVIPKDIPTSSQPAEMTGMIDPAGYMVQVAAVSKKEDADALVGALRKKNYAVVVSSNEPHDQLYHVQVGPFAEVKDAEGARAKLVSDGYNPILKK